MRAEAFTKSYASKYKRATRAKMQGGAFINRPQYSYYAKKFQCPCCGKRRYAQVLNINDLNQTMTRSVLRAGVRWLILMAVGGAFILAAASVPLYFAGRAGDQRTEELREQQYEDFKERYGL